MRTGGWEARRSTALRNTGRTAERCSAQKTQPLWGDQRDSNPRDRSHNPVPEPLGHGLTAAVEWWSSMRRA